MTGKKSSHLDEDLNKIIEQRVLFVLAILNVVICLWFRPVIDTILRIVLGYIYCIERNPLGNKQGLPP